MNSEINDYIILTGEKKSEEKNNLKIVNMGNYEVTLLLDSDDKFLKIVSIKNIKKMFLKDSNKNYDEFDLKTYYENEVDIDE